jgi:hypothetical protein
MSNGCDEKYNHTTRVLHLIHCQGRDHKVKDSAESNQSQKKRLASINKPMEKQHKCSSFDLVRNKQERLWFFYEFGYDNVTHFGHFRLAPD